MNESLALYSYEEFERELACLMEEKLRGPYPSPRKHPRAVLLGGQSGAGKTKLQKILHVEFEGDIAIINGDEYRSRHPRYYELDAAYGVDAVAHTAAWAGAMTEALIDELSKMGYNLVIEGTLRTSEVPLKTASLLRDRGYGVSLALMAVKPEISLISCQIRYELMRIAGTVPRATDPAHHDKIVRDIVGNVDALANSGLFEEVRLYSRAGACLFPLEGETRAAGQALEEVLFGPWTDEEVGHYEYLKRKLSALRSQG